MPEVRRFANKTIFITGIARGQGRAHALRLAQEGASIIGLDLCDSPGPIGYEPSSQADLQATIAEVESIGGRIVAHVGDVRSQNDCDVIVKTGIDAFGSIDGVIANAGICTYGRLWELSDDQWHSVIDTNLTGVFHTIRAVVPHMIKAGTSGSIVITSSGAGLKPLPLLGHYSASKAGVVAMARSLAHELAAHNIRVNTVHPTAVRTPMGRDENLKRIIAQHPEAAKAFGNLLPVGSVEPEDITAAVAWLLSDEARFVTGVALPVDAGTTIA